MSEGRWLDKFSDEFNIAHNNVATILGTKKFISDLEIWKVDNPLLHAKFDQHYSSSLKVDCWLNTEDIFDGTEEEVLSSIHGGFAFPIETVGMTFTTGKLNGVDGKTKVDPEKVTGFVMCILAVGKSFVTTSTDQRSTIVPKNYDSLYYSDVSAKKNSNQHWYYINNSARLLPTYYVKLKVCTDKKQALYQRAFKELDAEVAGESSYFYDVFSSRLLTAQERDSRGLSSSSNVVPVCEATKLFTQAAPDSAGGVALQEKVDHLDALLDIVEEKTRQVNANYGREHERIAELAEKAQSDLQRFTRRKLAELKSAETEVLRQMAQCNELGVRMQRAKHDLSTSGNVADHIQFVHSWKSLTALKVEAVSYEGSEVAAVQNMNPAVVVKGDMRVTSGAEEVPTGSWPERKSALETVLSLQQNDGSSVYAADGQPAEKIVCRDKQMVLDDTLLSVRREMALLSGAGARGSKTAPSPEHLNFSVPASIATTYGGSSWSNMLGETTPVGNNPCEVFDTSIRSMLAAEGNGGARCGTGAGLGASAGATALAAPPPPPLDNLRVSGTADQRSAAASSSGKTTMTRSSLFGGARSGPAAVAAMTAFDLEQVAEPLRQQNSLAAISGRKLKQTTDTARAHTKDKIFQGGSILQPQEAEMLYFSIPFFGGKWPVPRLVYSSQLHDRSLGELYKRSSGPDCECPSVLIIHSGEFVFGVYLSHRIRDNSLGSGSPSCFLFSMTMDMKISFHGKNPRVGSSGSGASTSGASTGAVPHAFIASENKFEVGNRDLCLFNTGGVLSSGSSELEGCFGVGMNKGSPEAGCLLAGQSQFPVDILEMWTLK